MGGGGMPRPREGLWGPVLAGLAWHLGLPKGNAERTWTLTLSISRSSMPLRSSSPSPHASAMGKHSTTVIWGQVLESKCRCPLGGPRTPSRVGAPPRGPRLWPRADRSPLVASRPGPAPHTVRSSHPRAACRKDIKPEPSGLPTTEAPSERDSGSSSSLLTGPGDGPSASPQ